MEELQKLVALCELNLDMERLCVYLVKDIQESDADSVELEQVVAEVSLVERVLMRVMGVFGTDDWLEEIVQDKNGTSQLLVNDEELGLIRSNMEELKTRLGIAGSMAKRKRLKFREVVAKYATKTKTTLDFYRAGMQMLWSDVQYSRKLLRKARSGQTLLPRELNSIRRTARDLANLVPFIIILMVPMTPIGSVLVLSFIQNNFPKFFPSCFTDKRQNLLRLCSDVLTIDDEALLGPAAKKTMTKRKKKRSRLSMLFKPKTLLKALRRKRKRHAGKVQSSGKTEVDTNDF